MLSERRWTFVLTAGAAFVASVVLIQSEPRSYEARTVVQLADGASATQVFDDVSLAEAAQQAHAVPDRAWWNRALTPGSESRVASLKQQLRIEEASNHIVQLRFHSADARQTANFLNALVESSILARRRAVEQAARELRDRIADVEARLAADLRDLRGTAPGSPARELLEDQVAAHRRLHATLLDRMNNELAPQDAGIRVIAKAQPPAEPDRAGRELQVLISTFGAIALGFAAVVIRDKTDPLIRTPEGAHGPILGAIPRARGDASPAGEADYVERIAWESKDSEESESFRAVLASLLVSPESQTRTLLITSPRAAEGKTTLACNLAIALAEIDRRVLLIDADLRRPRLHAILEVANTSGLGDLLCANASVLDLPPEQLVKKTAIPNLTLLPSGPGTDGIFNRLYSARMSRLLARFRGEFDHVIVDAPPALEVADARALARSVDGVVVVLRAGRSDKRDAAEVIEQIKRDGARFIGTVLNGWPSSPRGLRYRRSYGYHAGRDAEVDAAFNGSVAR